MELYSIPQFIWLNIHICLYRACVGESLARDTFFLFLVNIFQKYCVNLSMESKDVTLDAKAGFVLPPQDYKVILSERS